MMFYTSKERSR